MTWKEFKEAVEKEGVRDEEKLSYIDVDFDACGEVTVWIDRDGRVQITHG